MPHSYDTLVEAINDFKAKGYTEDFNMQSNCIECKAQNLNLHPKDFTIDEVVRFEGMSNPGDSSVLYAISSNKGLKGLLVDSYGAYADSLSEEMIEKLRIRR